VSIYPSNRFRIPRVFHERGFTLVELLVTVSLIILFVATAAAYNRSADQQVALFREQGKVINSVYNARSLAIETYSRSGDRSTVPCGYGIHIDEGGKSIVLFKDLPLADGSCQVYEQSNFIPLFNAGEIVETIALTDVSVSATFSDILFVPPDPKVYVYGVQNFPDPVSLTLSAPRAGFDVTMSINQFGQISTVQE